MKALAAYLASFACYWLGHSISCVMRRGDWLSFLYPAYNRLMLWSCDAEDWAGIEFMWRAPEKWGGTD